ncbi:hypothetical protein [Pedobacter miscanthi]|jgi:hypothetical protein|uniref:hypothetical protein n=1 Tax=Pedobacter miscanthi TaxID=2259170 RepID=UPI0029305347|nr:hypothetical protein [Pedobacter miscanthi]
MENFDHILLFKTNIEAANKEQLNGIFIKEGITEWNIDLDDEDHVLRIISYSLKHTYIIQLIKSCGFECCKLT